MDPINIKITNARLDICNILTYDVSENAGLLDKLKKLIKIEKMIKSQKHHKGWRFCKPANSLDVYIDDKSFMISCRSDQKTVSHDEWDDIDYDECYLGISFLIREDGLYDAMRLFLHGFVRKARDHEAERLYTEEIKDMIESL